MWTERVQNLVCVLELEIPKLNVDLLEGERGNRGRTEFTWYLMSKNTAKDSDLHEQSGNSKDFTSQISRPTFPGSATEYPEKFCERGLSDILGNVWIFLRQGFSW